MTTGGVIYLNKRTIALLLIIIFLIFSIRMLYSQHIYTKESDKLVGLEKVKAYEKVILFHFPLSPYTKKAVKGMIIECEGLNKNNEKLYCYETLRSSLIQIKSFYQPYKTVIESINPTIAHLRAIEMINWKENNFIMKNYQSLYAFHLNILNYENAPSILWSIITVFSLLGWIGSVFLIILKGLGNPLNKKILITGTGGFIIFFTLWLVGLYMA